jgi:hypothetical protein
MTFLRQFFYYFTLFLITSCTHGDDLIPTGPFLTVLVEGALSGKSRDDVKVTLYTSEMDAEDEVNAVGYSYSDQEGHVYFDRLDYITYWARANTILGLNKTIREITIIDSDNELFLPVL